MEIKVVKYDEKRWIVEMSDNGFTYHLVPTESKEEAIINKDAIESLLSPAINSNLDMNKFISEDEINLIMHFASNDIFVHENWKELYSYRQIFQIGFKNCYYKIIDQLKFGKFNYLLIKKKLQ